MKRLSCISSLLSVFFVIGCTLGQNIRNKNVHCDDWNTINRRYYDYDNYPYGYERIKTTYQCVIRNYEFVSDREYYIDKSEDVTNLTIVDSVLENLPKSLMIHFTSLETLIVRTSTLNYVDEINFGNVTQLEFSSSKILSLSENAFSKCKYLERINLSNNSIKELNYNIFANIKNLQLLDLSHNQLKVLKPTENFQTTNFSIKVSFNKLTSLNFENLTKFNCAEIYAESNEISVVSLGNVISTLKILNLNDNKLGNNLQDICRCENLSEIYLASNDIDNIGSCLSAMKYLKRIDLSRNKIFLLNHDNFYTNNEIEYLDLSFNLLETVDEYTLSIFTKLHYLYLKGNLLSNFYENPKFLMPQLVIIGLSHNKFKCSNLFLLLTKCKEKGLQMHVDRSLPKNTTNIDGIACYHNDERELLKQTNSTNILSAQAEEKIRFLWQKLNTLENNVNKMILDDKQEENELKTFKLDLIDRLEEIAKFSNKKLELLENIIKNLTVEQDGDKSDQKALGRYPWNNENNFISNVKSTETALESSSSSNTLLYIIVFLLIVMVSINLFIVLRKFDSLCFYPRRGNPENETPLTNVSTM